MRLIGLTGGIASGKSIVSKTMQDLGAAAINTDAIGHSIIEPHKPAWDDLIEYFGPEILNDDLTINRQKLGEIVFNAPEKLAKLNYITHPRIIAEMRSNIEFIKETNPDRVLVIEVPLLYETHMEKIFDEIWVVWVDRDTQIKRLMARDGIGVEDAIRRIESQMPLDEKAKRADVLIDNRHNIEETISIVTRNFNNILSQS
ncbi:MAG: dephospho-CoA kinase [Syntrophomonadaceae bacterium]|nr:dephospho-CoA kinase [Syntrophomonadaceae bacterium]